MANDSHNCSMPDWYLTLHEKTYFSVYYIVTPLYFIFGMIGHILCVSAFWKQLKHDAAYLYQIFTSVNEILEILTFTLFISSFYWWSGAEAQGAQWFMSSYFCMWYAAHLATPLVNMFITTSMFLSLSTTGDRLYALLKPFAYKSANHKRHKCVAFSISIILGVGTSIFDCFRFQLTSKGDIYQLTVDEVYVASLLATVLAQLRNCVRVFGVLALIVSNTILVSSFRKHNRQVAAMSSTVARTDVTDGKENQRRLREKTLMILTICDSVLTTIGMTMLISYYVGVYISPTFTTCEGLLMAPVLDGTLQITEMANFYIVFSTSKQFREMVAASLPSFCRRVLRLTAVKTSVHQKANLRTFSYTGRRSTLPALDKK